MPTPSDQAREMMDRQLVAHGAADRRPAGCLSDQPQQDGAAPVARAAGRRGRHRGGDGPPAHRGRRTRVDRLAAARAGLPRRRPDPAGPGVRQPADQQCQVHSGAAAESGSPPSGGAGKSRSPSGTRALASRPSLCPSIFDMFSQVDRSIGALHGRARHRSGAGEGTGRDARRHCGGRERRSRAGQHVHRHASCAGGPATTGRRGVRQRTGRAAAAAADPRCGRQPRLAPTALPCCSA